MSGHIPNLFIIGAPKCGTTSLATWLAEHPAVFMPALKEPHFFSTDLENRNVTSKSEYLALFRKTDKNHLIVGEASTWYLYSNDAVPNIERFCNSPRYIVMTRDPVEMVQSLYFHNLRHLHEDVLSLEEAWKLQTTRAKGRSIPSTCREPAFLQYRAACSLGSLLQRVYNQVDPERILHLRLERVRESPKVEYSRVLEFLGLPDDSRSEFPVLNEARLTKSRYLQRVLLLAGRLRIQLGIHRSFGLLRRNEQPFSKPPLQEATLNFLHQEFHMESELLLKLNCK